MYILQRVRSFYYLCKFYFYSGEYHSILTINHYNPLNDEEINFDLFAKFTKIQT